MNTSLATQTMPILSQRQSESGTRQEVKASTYLLIIVHRFISIVPVAPTNTDNGLDPQYWYPELLDKVVDAVIAKYPVDTNRFHVSGYRYVFTVQSTNYTDRVLSPAWAPSEPGDMQSIDPISSRPSFLPEATPSRTRSKTRWDRPYSPS
jgi:hypothetical protein